jgi:hypothetical protein
MSERDIDRERTGPEERVSDGGLESLFLEDDSIVIYDPENRHAWIRASEGAVELPGEPEH